MRLALRIDADRARKCGPTSTVAVEIDLGLLTWLVGAMDDLAHETHATGVEAPRNKFYEVWECLHTQWRVTC